MGRLLGGAVGSPDRERGREGQPGGSGRVLEHRDVRQHQSQRLGKKKKKKKKKAGRKEAGGAVQV